MRCQYRQERQLLVPQLHQQQQRQPIHLPARPGLPQAAQLMQRTSARLATGSEFATPLQAQGAVRLQGLQQAALAEQLPVQLELPPQLLVQVAAQQPQVAEPAAPGLSPPLQLQY